MFILENNFKANNTSKTRSANESDEKRSPRRWAIASVLLSHAI